MSSVDEERFDGIPRDEVGVDREPIAGDRSDRSVAPVHADRPSDERAEHVSRVGLAPVESHGEHVTACEADCWHRMNGNCPTEPTPYDWPAAFADAMREARALQGRPPVDPADDLAAYRAAEGKSRAAEGDDSAAYPAPWLVHEAGADQPPCCPRGALCACRIGETP